MPDNSTKTRPPAHPARQKVFISASWISAVVAIGLQIWWPLANNATRVGLSVAIVALFALASVAHAAAFRGVPWAVWYVVIVVGVGLGVETLGVHTGVPFSDYRYEDVLQPQIFGVPLLIPLAWTMMAYLAFVVAQTLAQRWWSQIVVGGIALAAWDLFLDPQMVAEGYWTWLGNIPGLPGVPDIPWVNYLGWLATGLVMMSALVFLTSRLRLLETDTSNTNYLLVPAILYGWTWVGGIIANAFFFDRPWVALWGGIGMGIVAVPYLIRVAGQMRNLRIQSES